MHQWSVGDFNVDLLKHMSNNHSQVFLNVLLSNGFYPKIDRPIRITVSSATLIDNIITNHHDSRSKSGIWLADVSDHLPVFIPLPRAHTAKLNSSKFYYITKRYYTVDNMSNFKEHLRSYDWSSVYSAHTTNCKYDCFTRALELSHDKCFPLVTSKVKNAHQHKPWIRLLLVF